MIIFTSSSLCFRKGTFYSLCEWNLANTKFCAKIGVVCSSVCVCPLKIFLGLYFYVVDILHWGVFPKVDYTFGLGFISYLEEMGERAEGTRSRKHRDGHRWEQVRSLGHQVRGIEKMCVGLMSSILNVCPWNAVIPMWLSLFCHHLTHVIDLWSSRCYLFKQSRVEEK